METPPPNYANYPRYTHYGQTSHPPAPPVPRFEAIGEAWRLTMADLGTFAVAAFLVGVLESVVAWPTSFLINYLVYGDVFAVQQLDARYALSMTLNYAIGIPVNYVFGAGLFSMCLKRLRGLPVNIGNLFDGFPVFLPLAAAGLITFILKGLGFTLLIVPGLYLIGVLSFVPLLILDRKLSAIDAIGLSFRTLNKHWALMSVVIIAGAVVAGVGVIACCIGIVLTVPIYYFVIALHYHAFFPPESLEHVPQPPYPLYRPPNAPYIPPGVKPYPSDPPVPPPPDRGGGPPWQAS